MPGEETEREFGDEEKKDYIVKLKKLLSDDDNLNKLQCSDNYLERFLYSTNFVVGKAFKRMKMFYDFLEEYPDWFSMGSPLEKKVVIEKNIRLPTNIYDKDGRPVYIVKLGNMSSNTMDLLSDVIPVDDFFMELLLSSDPKTRNGISVVIDVSNFPWNLMKWLTPHNIRLMLRRIQTMPVKEFRYHVVNKSMLIHAAINIVWPFLPQYIRDTIKFHFDDRNSLYECIDREVLPVEYGGTNKLDYTKCRDKVYDKNEEIADSFRTNRELYYFGCSMPDRIYEASITSGSRVSSNE